MNRSMILMLAMTMACTPEEQPPEETETGDTEVEESDTGIVDTGPIAPEDPGEPNAPHSYEILFVSDAPMTTGFDAVAMTGLGDIVGNATADGGGSVPVMYTRFIRESMDLTPFLGGVEAPHSVGAIGESEILVGYTDNGTPRTQAIDVIMGSMVDLEGTVLGGDGQGIRVGQMANGMAGVSVAGSAMTHAGPMGASILSSVALGANSEGTIALDVTTATGTTAYLDTTAGTDQLPVDAGDTHARAINEAGVVVGAAEDTNGLLQPVVWDEGLTQLGLVSWPETVAHGVANDINTDGVVVGTDYDGVDPTLSWGWVAVDGVKYRLAPMVSNQEVQITAALDIADDGSVLVVAEFEGERVMAWLNHVPN